MPDATGTAQNQDGLACVDVCAIDQAFPGGDERQRQAGRFAHAEVGRFVRQQRRIHRRVFGQRALDTTDATGHAINRVAGLETADTRAHRFNHASHVDAEDAR